MSLRKLKTALLSVALSIAGSAAAAIPAHAGQPAAGQSSKTACHNIAGFVHVPNAPRGYAYVVSAILGKDCHLTVSRASLVARSANPLTSPGSDPQASSHYRLWDYVGNKLNASATVLTWNTSNGYVSSASVHQYTYEFWDGWYLAAAWAGGYSGCVGCTSYGAEGWAEFKYGNTVYDNTDWAYITGNGDGSYSGCSQSWWWAVGFPGWHVQTWCEWGYSGV